MLHAYNGRKVYNIRMNGVTINAEGVINSVIAGRYDISVVAAIGDKAFKDEMKSFIPGVKRPSSRTISYTGDGETIFKLQELIIFRLVDDLL